MSGIHVLGERKAAGNRTKRQAFSEYRFNDCTVLQVNAVTGAECHG